MLNSLSLELNLKKSTQRNWLFFEAEVWIIKTKEFIAHYRVRKVEN